MNDREGKCEDIEGMNKPIKDFDRGTECLEG